MGFLKILTLREKLLLVISLFPWRFKKVCPGYLREMSSVSIKAKRAGYLIDVEDNFVIYHNNIDKYYLRKNSTDFLVFEQVILNNEYLAIVNHIKALGSQNQIMSIVDAGANTGFTTRFFRKEFENAQILAVEPDNDNIQALKKNIKHSLLDRFQLLEGGFWFEDTYLKIDRGYSDGREWSLTLVEATEGNFPKIPCFSLQSIMEFMGVEQIDILKIDIEGGEQPIFEYWNKNNSILSKVMNIAIEIHDDVSDRDMIISVLNDSGFKTIELGETTFGFR